MKTKEELNFLKQPVELNDETLGNVNGGLDLTIENLQTLKEKYII